jgi:hypothetical protein
MTTDTAVAQANAAMMRRAVDAFGSGDMATLTEVFAPELKWHVPGRSAIAGDYIGRDAVFAFFGKAMTLTSGTFKVNALEIIGDEKGGVFITNDTGERNGKKLDVMLMLRVHIRGGKFVEVWEHIADLYAHDEFWTAKQQDPGTE